MLWLAAAAIAASAPTSAPPTPVAVQARATVRIISGVRVKLDGSATELVPPPHVTIVHSDGTAQRERLIEFE
jgi:hypothetical protein